MSELLTLQDLANGHLDVQALGEAANGDENTIVTTRTGNTYPSAERAINIMFQNGGLPAEPFATKANMEIDGAALADGQLAMVYHETANNGLYVKTAGVWVKSAYDPLTQAKSYTDAAKVSPTFTGVPKAPTAANSSNDETIATTKFVKDVLSLPYAATVGLNTATHVGDTFAIDIYSDRYGLINAFGENNRTLTIELLRDRGKEITINNTSYGTGEIRLKVSGSAATTVVKRGVTTYHITSNLIFDKSSSKAPIDSPVFLGKPTADTPVILTYDKQLATTAFVGNVAHGVLEHPITDSSTLVNSHNGNIIRFTGTLTKDSLLVIPKDNTSNIYLNDTTGGFKISLKGNFQNEVETRIVLEPKQAKQVYVVNQYAYNIPMGQSGGGSVTMPIATASRLGGIKVGAGLSVTTGGTLSAVSQSALSLSYAGKFKSGGDYTAGQLVEHGSGLYEVKVDTVNAITPLDNPNFNKLQHNYTAGANKEISVVSNVLTDGMERRDTPFYMSRSGMVMFNNGTGSLRISRDCGVTWSNNHPFTPPFPASWLRWTRETDDGELLCGVSQVDTPNPDKFSIFKSSGWNEIKGTVTSWDNVLEIQRKNVFMTEWAFSQYKNLVIVGEYGGKNNAAVGEQQDEYPRYCYLSKDYGQTFEIIFDLADYTNGRGVHVHGVSYDKYWNRIWLTHGDGGLGTSGLYYSDDLGKTWLKGWDDVIGGGTHPQSVAITPMPTCILFSSDSYPNGVQRIDRAQGRTPKNNHYKMEAGYFIAGQENTLHQILGTPIYADWLPDSPVIWNWNAQTMPSNSGCVMTWDGWTFHEVWISDKVYPTGFGAKTAIGITPENTIIVTGDDRVDGVTKIWKRTIKVLTE